MTTTDSLGDSMKLAVKHYSSLFLLPAYRGIISLQALTCILGGLISIIVTLPTVAGFFWGLSLGFSLFIVSLSLDYITSKSVLRNDPIYDLRRTSTLSLFSMTLWVSFSLVGSATAALTSNFQWWIRISLLGFSAAQIARLIVLKASSSKTQAGFFLASLVPPYACLLPFVAIWTIAGHSIAFNTVLFVIFSTAVAIASSQAFIYSLDKLGSDSLDIGAMALFRAFLLSWISDVNAPFEEFLENLGQEQNVELFLIKFGSEKTKAVMAIPSVHPGPFKNIGSSPLPFLLKKALEKNFGCNACVPHGLFSHEQDLASQVQNQKVITHVVEAMNFQAVGATASPFVTVSNSSASASCQIFGDFALLSLTLAPKTTEDLPPELGVFVREEAKKHRLACCAVVNAHNSIDSANDMTENLDSLKHAAVACIEKATSLEKSTFEVGAATVTPKEFGLKDGMGQGGIVTIVIRAGNQKAAYVVIDGNNMVSGLREEILSALGSTGIDTGEVYTTDTHSVNAVILGERGYNPIGEAIDHDKLIDHVKEAVLQASSNLERAEAGCRHIDISGVKVIGAEQLKKLALLTDKGSKKARKIIAPILVCSGLALMLFLLLI